MNTEKILAVANLLEQRTDLPFSMDRCSTCIAAYVELMVTGKMPEGNSESDDIVVETEPSIVLLGEFPPSKRGGEILMPAGWLHEPEQFPRKMAVKMLRNLVLTGRVEW